MRNSGRTAAGTSLRLPSARRPPRGTGRNRWDTVPTLRSRSCHSRPHSSPVRAPVAAARTTKARSQGRRSWWAVVSRMPTCSGVSAAGVGAGMAVVRRRRRGWSAGRAISWRSRGLGGGRGGPGGWCGDLARPACRSCGPAGPGGRYRRCTCRVDSTLTDRVPRWGRRGGRGVGGSGRWFAAGGLCWRAGGRASGPGDRSASAHQRL